MTANQNSGKSLYTMDGVKPNLPIVRLRFSCYTKEYQTCYLNFLQRKACVYKMYKNTSDNCEIPWYVSPKRCITLSTNKMINY